MDLYAGICNPFPFFLRIILPQRLGREESVWKRHLVAIGRALITRGFGEKIGRGGRATTPLERNRPRSRLLFARGFIFRRTDDSIRRSIKSCPVLREKGGREGGREGTVIGQNARTPNFAG